MLFLFNLSQQTFEAVGFFQGGVVEEPQFGRMAQLQAGGDLALDVADGAFESGERVLVVVRLQCGEIDFRQLEVWGDIDSGQGNAFNTRVFDFASYNVGDGLVEQTAYSFWAAGGHNKSLSVVRESQRL